MSEDSGIELIAGGIDAITFGDDNTSLDNFKSVTCIAKRRVRCGRCNSLMLKDMKHICRLQEGYGDYVYNCSFISELSCYGIKYLCKDCARDFYIVWREDIELQFDDILDKEMKKFLNKGGK